MLLRFYLYSVLKNLRFADPFLVLYFLSSGLSFTAIGTLLGIQHAVTALLEFPSGVMADHWGRRRTLAACFLCYALSFAAFSGTSWRPLPIAVWFAICLSLFALGEAFRTGSHKAIILDYLDSSGQSDLATRVLGRTRMASKLTSALSALAGGLVLYAFRQYEPLFWLSAAGAFGGLCLTLTYPRSLEGERYRKRQGIQESSDTPTSQPRSRRFRQLIAQSVIFESQIKIMIKFTWQPFLKAGLDAAHIAVATGTGTSGLAATGAIWIGLNDLIRDGCGAIGARCSERLESALAGRIPALNRAYLIAGAATLGLAALAVDSRAGFVCGILLFFLLNFLQNARRPIFVAALNEETQRPNRAAALSFESVLRSIVVAVLIPALGYLADQFGLATVWFVLVAMLLAGALFQPQANDASND